MGSFLFLKRRKNMSYLYLYDGPVTRFGICIVNRYIKYTNAPSEKKAKSNICAKFKKENGYLQTAKIELPGKLVLVERKQDGQKDNQSS